MDLRTRWYFTRPVDAVLIGRPGGRCPSAFRHLDFRRPGIWSGCLDVPGSDFQVLAITWDVDVVGAGAFGADAMALVRAPDGDALEVPGDLSTSMSAWPKLAKLEAKLFRDNLDPDRVKGASTVRHGLRAVARECLLQQAVGLGPTLSARGRHFLPKRLARKSRDALLSRVGRARVDPWRDDESIGRWVNRVISSGFAREFVDGGRFHLGRREAHLGPRTVGAGAVVA